MKYFMKERLNEILLSRKIRENIKFVSKAIPSIVYMFNFKHNHPHHNLDVFEHTLKVVDGIKDDDVELLMAALLHDIGKPFSYQDEEVRHFRGHAEVSEKIARDALKKLNYDENFVNNVCYLVKYHDTLIDVENLDNTYDMVMKRLKLQFADAKAHAPNVVKKRLDVLNRIKNELETKYN